MCRKGGKWSCEPRCQGALVQREKMKNLDSHCFERASNDECCSIVRCDDAADAEIIDGKFSSHFFILRGISTSLSDKFSILKDSFLNNERAASMEN